MAGEAEYNYTAPWLGQFEHSRLGCPLFLGNGSRKVMLEQLDGFAATAMAMTSVSP